MPQSFLANALALRHMRDQRAMQQQAQQQHQPVLDYIAQMQTANPEMYEEYMRHQAFGGKPPDRLKQLQAQAFENLLQGMRQPQEPVVGAGSMLGPHTVRQLPPTETEPGGLASVPLPQQMAQQQMGLPQELQAAGMTPEALTRALWSGDMKDAFDWEIQSPTRVGQKYPVRTKGRILSWEDVEDVTQIPHIDPVTGQETMRIVPTKGGMPVPGAISEIETKGVGREISAATRETSGKLALERLDEARALLFKGGKLQTRALVGMKLPTTPGASTLESKLIQALSAAVKLTNPTIRPAEMSRAVQMYMPQFWEDEATVRKKLDDAEELIRRSLGAAGVSARGEEQAPVRRVIRRPDGTLGFE